MKFQNILLLLTACLLAGSCSDDDNDGAWFLPRTLQVMDAKTDAPRANEPLTLNFIGDDGELYSHRHTTDENGCIHFKGSTRGEYRAAFSYFPGTASDCFHSFRLDSGDEAPIIMTVEPLSLIHISEPTRHYDGRAFGQGVPQRHRHYGHAGRRQG